MEGVVLKSFDHKNFLKFIEMYEDDMCIYLVTEMLDMDLFEYMNTYHDFLTE